MFNLVGYHLPPPPADQPNPMAQHEDCRLFFDKRLYTETLTKQDKTKRITFKTATDEDILSDLTQSDVRVLMLTEDELSRCGQFNRVFPSATSSQYLKYFDKPRYYNYLLDAWEQRYKDNRDEGIRRLCSLARFLDQPPTIITTTTIE
jgi:tubulin polyglutamylase TTLL4